MAGGSSPLNAAAVLSPSELQHQQDVEAGTRPAEGVAAPRRKQKQPQAGDGDAGRHGGPSRAAVRGLWVALVVSLLALAGTVGFNLYMLRERQQEKRENLHLASGTTANSSNALGMARAAHDRSIKLEQEVEQLGLQFNATVQRLQAQQAAAQAAADARWLAQCEALLAQEQEGEAEAAAAATHTAYVCQAETGWALNCPGGGAATVTQALVGRFTSSPDGPCSEGARPGQLALCPNSADVTAQVRVAARAAGGGKAGVSASPLALLAEAGRANPCPRSLLQLQVLYSCRAADPAARAERCRQALVAAGGGGGSAGVGAGAGMYGEARLPGAAPQKR